MIAGLKLPYIWKNCNRRSAEIQVKRVCFPLHPHKLAKSSGGWRGFFCAKA